MAKKFLSDNTTNLILGLGALFVFSRSDILGKIGQGVENALSGIGDIGTGAGLGIASTGAGVQGLGYGVGQGVSSLGYGVGQGAANIGKGVENVGAGVQQLAQGVATAGLTVTKEGVIAGLGGNLSKAGFSQPSQQFAIQPVTQAAQTTRPVSASSDILFQNIQSSAASAAQQGFGTQKGTQGGAAASAAVNKAIYGTSNPIPTSQQFTQAQSNKSASAVRDILTNPFSGLGF